MSLLKLVGNTAPELVTHTPVIWIQSDPVSSALIGPVDCGGPFDLWEPNSTFSSPNYPSSYGNEAQCEFTCHLLQL